ncbi:exportin-2 [Octopus sinensis]|uniref:Exportin-2 n=1 Tax=Octopus sinensis TaxID=2607531 RepID=A0A6P7TL83_9MOLL|nr:exportin-2 [Octopus sinensis]
MEVTEGNLITLANYLQETLSSDVTTRRKAEKFLESVEINQNYPMLLLKLLDNSVDAHIRLSAAVTFKNYIKRNWRQVDDSPDKIHASDRTAIKQVIVDLMLKTPEQIQNQLSDAISIIGREDFPDKWPDLIREMVEHLVSRDFHIVNGILRTAHSLFKRYRHEFKSQELWTEIKFVLDNFAAQFTQLFITTMQLAENHSNDPVALKVIFSSIVLMCKIFYSLNYQDIPEHFEDNMATWMAHFKTLLQVDNKLLQTQDEDEAGVLEQVKSQICDNVTLYAQKYDEEFGPHLPDFVTAIWNLLVTTGQQVKYDLLVSNAIQFLASVAERPSYKKLFEESNTLGSICEKVIVPNMQFRTADEELFEDNPDEYIRRDIEGSDIDTRRRAACDLVQALCKIFEEPVIQNFSQYIQALLQQYSSNPTANWKCKDTAIYLVTSLVSKGQTQKHGITQTSSLVNITDFYQTYILTDLQSADVNTQSILKADALKYVMIFRTQLQREALIACIPHIIRHMAAESPVVHTYAAHCIERLLTVKNAQNTAMIGTADIQQFGSDLLLNLFNILNFSTSSENEYAMKAIMRCLSALNDSVMPLIPMVLGKLTQKLLDVSKNPSKPHFNHYLFESICVMVRVASRVNPTAVTTFEGALFAPFTEILRQDVQEFVPYVFQILSMLIELQQNELAPYMALFPHLLVPVLWERPGNIPPLVRLLQAIIQKGAKQIEPDKLNGLLGAFQKLIASKANDHEGFYLLNYIIEFLPQDVISPYINQIFMLLFQRLQSSKTTKYIKSLLVFFSLFAIKYEASVLIQTIDNIQAKMFGMVVERLYVIDLQKVSGNIERKICALGVTKLLTEAPVFLTTYESLWASLLQALLSLFELPEDESIPEDEHFIEIDDTPGYQIAYSQLAFAGRKEHDPIGNLVPDLKINLAKCLGKLSEQNPGRLTPLIKSGLQPEATQYLQMYLQSAGVNLM